MNAKRVRRWGMGLGAAAMLGVFPVLAAETADPAKMMYERYCSACHGSDGKGAGPVASFLTSKPTDLTHMAKQAGGQFPFVRLMQIIDGSEPIRAHGTTDMPVWAETFRRQAGASVSEHAEVRGRLMLITEYIRALQAK